jgi:predicted transposase YdaD
LELEEPERKDLEDLLIYAILQRFSKLSREEVEKMVELTPIEETVVGRNSEQ